MWELCTASPPSPVRALTPCPTTGPLPSQLSVFKLSYKDGYFQQFMMSVLVNLLAGLLAVLMAVVLF